MAIDFWQERAESGSFTVAPDEITLQFVTGRTGDENEVYAYSLLATSVIYKNLYRQSGKFKHVGGGLWHVDIPYGASPSDPMTRTPFSEQANPYRIQYDTTGGTAHITQAKAHVAGYAASGTATNHGGAINVAPDGRVEGVDIGVPSFRWSESHVLSIAVAGWGYSQILKALSYHINAAPFRGFARGQVLFTGATGTYASDADTQFEVPITFNFEQQDTATGLVYDGVTGVTKDGWDLLWFEHRQQVDASSNKMKSKLISVQRERVYDYADFSLLQIGS